eukprot:TRINITY_DN72582_c0_g1_i1.p1 TRINITY_DN72582_c0_g1~~TRINITY_DN72582_c0_g1_i1.p1  ORF type:complete len:156 (+),score=58.49 TRINITY_DN72582_c0_g1_i1:87-554(+)
MARMEDEEFIKFTEKTAIGREEFERVLQDRVIAFLGEKPFHGEPYLGLKVKLIPQGATYEAARRKYWAEVKGLTTIEGKPALQLRFEDQELGSKVMSVDYWSTQADPVLPLGKDDILQHGEEGKLVWDACEKYRTWLAAHIDRSRSTFQVLFPGK